MKKAFTLIKVPQTLQDFRLWITCHCKGAKRPSQSHCNMPKAVTNGSHLTVNCSQESTHPNLPSQGKEKHAPQALTDLTSYRTNDLTSSKKAAFSLAEVLITLAIIGIAAALTIPTLIHSYKKKEIETKLKRIYSIMNNAVELSIANNTWEKPPIDKRWDNDVLYDWLKETIIPYIKVARFCQADDTDCMCKKTNYDIYKPVCIEFLDGSALAFVNNTSIHTYYFINNKKAISGVTKFDFFLDYTTDKNLGYFYPSGYAMGYKDDEAIDNNELTDIYTYKDRNKTKLYCNSKYVNTSSTCALLIMMDGWKISDDYPIKF